MKKDIHPKYAEVKVSCSCGNNFVTRSTYGKPDLQIEVCSNCHPFYTGKQKVVASDRVQRFKDRYKKGGISISDVNSSTPAA